MLWEGKALRNVRENDLRQLVDSGLEEHLQLEYKSELYTTNDNGRREFLLDVCMFANTMGGILLIGIPERRDQQGQPTGVPDQDGVLGIEIANPEAVLAGYDARVMEAIEERLPLESAAIEVANGRRVLALRVPNSTRKPHSVRHQGHIYFPARRERQRYPMNVRELKELVMRAASRLQQAEGLLKESFLAIPRTGTFPYLMIGIVPVFFEDFSVNVRDENVRIAVGEVSRGNQPQQRETTFTFDGLQRFENNQEYAVRFRRDGLLNSSSQLPLQGNAEYHKCILTAIDVRLQRFVIRSKRVYEAAEIGAPFVLAMMLRTQTPLVGIYGGAEGVPYETEAMPAEDYTFPFMQVEDLSDVDRLIRPLCDQSHQMFGLEGSPSFNAQGVWTARYAIDLGYAAAEQMPSDKYG